MVRISRSVILACGSLRWWRMWSKSPRMRKVAMILSSVVDLRVRGGGLYPHTREDLTRWQVVLTKNIRRD